MREHLIKLRKRVAKTEIVRANEKSKKHLANTSIICTVIDVFSTMDQTI